MKLVSKRSSVVARDCQWLSAPFPKTEGAGFSLAAVSGIDVWAVGTEWHEYPAPTYPLILHWNGRRWSRVRAPRLPNVEMRHAAAASPTRAWAVGWNTEAGGTVALMWNGTRWRRVSSPNDRRTSNNKLEKVHVVGPADVWAIGETYDANRNAHFPLVQRWDGRRWKIVRAGLEGELSLRDIHGISAHNIRMVGSRTDTTNRAVDRAVMFRWNGSRWRPEPLPRASLPASRLTSVAVVSATEAWATGGTDTPVDRGETGEFRPYDLRWDGQLWRQTKALPGGGLYVDPHRRLWAQTGTRLRPRLARRDRGRWTMIRTPLEGRAEASITSLNKSPTGAIWMAGTYWDPASETRRDVLARYLCRA
jgi:hypothetical protein